MVRQADTKAQLEQFSPDPFRSPQSVVPGHFLDQGHGLWGDLWFGRRRSGLVLPIQPQSLTVLPQKSLWLNDEQRVFPCSNHPCEKHEEQAIRIGTDRAFDMSAQECVFCHEFGLASGKICQRPHHERGGGARFGPVYVVVVKRLKAKACRVFDEEKNPMHSVHYSF